MKKIYSPILILVYLVLQSSSQEIQGRGKFSLFPQSDSFLSKFKSNFNEINLNGRFQTLQSMGNQKLTIDIESLKQTPHEKDMKDKRVLEQKVKVIKDQEKKVESNEKEEIKPIEPKKEEKSKEKEDQKKRISRVKARRLKSFL